MLAGSAMMHVEGNRQQHDCTVLPARLPVSSDCVGSASSDCVGSASSDRIGSAISNRIGSASSDRIGSVSSDHMESVNSECVGQSAVSV